jgi:hypothetical protein
MRLEVARINDVWMTRPAVTLNALLDLVANR